ncbi:tetratricopeptide repeat protein [Comamonas terrae]|uniref:Tetratricopeptide repeat protein n=1 Tax=Comamonas terrae TaxID=673548 RepID=A0ABW5UHX7_9BURK|nr:tetratricopeptide repeat protein [Comamonas terrae]
MPVRNLMSSAVRLTALSAAMAAALMCGSARADDYTDIAQLLKNGKTEQALQRTDTSLAANPRDPQMRFLRAVALTNLNRTEDAVAALRQLTEDYPELPEPYNNLAVIYARQGELEKARAALENAVRNNPDYAVAHENLGDIHVRLAYQSYAQARAKGGRAANLQPKMKLLKEVLQLSSTAAKPAQPAASAPVAAEAPARGAPKP